MESQNYSRFNARGEKHRKDLFNCKITILFYFINLSNTKELFIVVRLVIRGMKI